MSMKLETTHGCNEALRKLATQNIESFHHREQPIGALRPAAVAIVIAAHRGNPLSYLRAGPANYEPIAVSEPYRAVE